MSLRRKKWRKKEKSAFIIKNVFVEITSININKMSFVNENQWRTINKFEIDSLKLIVMIIVHRNINKKAFSYNEIWLTKKIKRDDKGTFFGYKDIFSGYRDIFPDTKTLQEYCMFIWLLHHCFQCDLSRKFNRLMNW